MITITNKQLFALKDKIDALDIRAIIRVDNDIITAKVTKLTSVRENISFIIELDNNPEFLKFESIKYREYNKGPIEESIYVIMTDYNQHIEGYEVTEHGELIDLDTGEILQP